MAEYTLTLDVTADTYVNTQAPSTNYGNATTIEAENTSNGWRKMAYIKFPTPSIPKNKEILRAYLRVYGTIAEVGSSNEISMGVYYVTSEWEENFLTMSNRPTYQGGSSSIVVWGSGQWNEMSIYFFVKRLYENQATNYGIQILPSTGGSSTRIGFNSRESATNKPQVIIKYRDWLPLIPTGLIPNGISIFRGQTVDFSWEFNTKNDNDKQTKFDLQWSEDQITWNTISQTTSNNHYSMSTAVFPLWRVYWRVRTYDNYGQVSDWSEEAYLDVSGALAPTNLAPNGYQVNVSQSIVFTWRFNSGLEEDHQTKFDFEWSADGGQNWTTITQTTQSESYTMPPNTLPQGQTVWRVRTYDSLGQQSAWSDQAVIATFGAPTVPVITMPNIATTANPIVTWTTSDLQYAFEVQVLNGTEMYWTSGETFSPSKSVEIGRSLQNSTTYTIRVRIKNEHNLWSDWATKDILTDYAEPAEPILILTSKQGYIEIAIRNVPGDAIDYGFITDPVTEVIDYGFITDEPTEYIDFGFIDEASVEYNEIFRREEGGEWIRIATNISTDGIYQDYGVASDVEYEYMAVAYGITGGIAESEIETSVITLRFIWLHEADNPQETAYVFRYSNEREDDWRADVGYMQFAGRVSPVAEFGEAESYSVRFNLRLKDKGDFEHLKRLIKSKKTLCYRDARGRKVFGIFANLPIQDRFFGHETSLEIVQVDYKEGI